MPAKLNLQQTPQSHDLLVQKHAVQPAVVLVCQGARSTRQLHALELGREVGEVGVG